MRKINTQQPPQATTTGYQQDIIEALTNLATATASDRAIVNSLTATNRDLMTQLSKVNAELITALKKINYMRQVILDLKPKFHSGSPSISPLTGHNHYCWSCGFKSSHSSHKCNDKKKEHQDKATTFNTLNGIRFNYNK